MAVKLWAAYDRDTAFDEVLLYCRTGKACEVCSYEKACPLRGMMRLGGPAASVSASCGASRAQLRQAWKKRLPFRLCADGSGAGSNMNLLLVILGGLLIELISFALRCRRCPFQNP
jgi:hypothetical protein